MKSIHNRLLLLATFLFAFSFIHAQKQSTFKSEEGKCSMKFPVEYTLSEENNDTIKVIKASCLNEEQTFFGTFTFHSIKMTDHDKKADKSVVNFGEIVNAELISKSDWIVDGHNGKKAIFMMTEHNIKIEYRVLLVGQIQYQIICMAVKPKYNEDLATQFFESFKLKK